ncbi:hypothetical protein DSL72_003975 [Monilinia vaccinii-corymbosi]|uniref:Uncharacterized protein n=1 Tax=Monilinia vaccinii-corymbosi TaxID=61207 RepID=A0A8A3P3M2_9HELO|nr:hypothetical protein DSL72_003975 [Monilinia vaccinii-corymbosi]
MHFQDLVFALFVTGAFAAPTSLFARSECAQSCIDADNKCRGDEATRNMATCSSNFYSCLGAIPTAVDGKTVPPTVCSAEKEAAFQAASNTNTVSKITYPDNAPKMTLKNFTRYCDKQNTGCDYNFVISRNDGSEERCTILRNPGSGAIDEFFSGVPCTSGSSSLISWSLSYQFGPGNEFSIITVTNTASKDITYFGVTRPNSQPVTDLRPAGSGAFGDLGPSDVQTF